MRMHSYLAISVTLFFVACSAQQNPYDGKLVMPKGFPPAPESSQTSLALQPVSFHTFRSEKLGFSFEYPDTILVYESICGQRYAQEPSTVIEDAPHKTIYFGPARTATGGIESASCTNIPNTPALIAAAPGFNEWSISLIDDVKDEKELLAAVRRVYGPECIFDERQEKVGFFQHRADSQPGFLRYRVRPPEDPSMEPGDPRCPIHSAVIVKFSPALHRAVHWNLGQEAKFWIDETDTESYDARMIDSVTLF